MAVFIYFSSHRQKDDDLQRRIRKQIRALELLKQSKLPHNMELQEEKKMLEVERNQMFIKEMNRLQRELNEKEKKRRHKFFHDIPDHDAKYRKFIIELETRKAYNRKNTQAKPFNLMSGTRARDCEHESFYKASTQPSFARSSSSMSRLSKFTFKYIIVIAL